MIISAIRFLAPLLLCCSMLHAPSIYAQDSPHWTSEGCVACHEGGLPADGKVNPKEVEALCDTCHGSRGDAIPCRHASGVSPENVVIPEALSASLNEGRVVCSTCHDIVYQCEHPKLHYSFQNRGFLRDRTSNFAADYCNKCHEPSVLGRLNPHDGYAGDPSRSTCTLCHAGIPESNEAGDLDVAFNLPNAMNEMCLGCHNVRPHPKSMFSFNPAEEEGWVHLTVPSSAVLERLRVMQAKTGIELPLDPRSGEVFCATCHNPHAFKVGGPKGSQSRDSEHRLRLNNICQACHDK